MNEVVSANSSVTARMIWTYHSNTWWIVIPEDFEKGIHPASSLQQSVIVDSIVVFDIVQIGFQHGIVLCPGRLASVATLNEVDRRIETFRTLLRHQSTKGLLEGGGEVLIGKDSVVVVESKVEMVAETLAYGFTESR